MGVEADRLRAEQQELQKELEALKAIKAREEADLAEHEVRLKEATDKLAAAKESGGANEALFTQFVEKFRKEAKADRSIKKQQLVQEWELTDEYLKKQKEALLKEESEAYLERKTLQRIKIQLREQGVAEFQTYSPSNLGDTPPGVDLLKQDSFSQSLFGTGRVATTKATTPAVPPTPSDAASPFGRPFNEETDVKIADHLKDPATPGNLTGFVTITPAPPASGNNSVPPVSPSGDVTPATDGRPFGRPFNEDTDVKISNHIKSPATPNNIMLATTSPVECDSSVPASELSTPGLADASPLALGCMDSPASSSATFARPFNEATDVKIADHHDSPATPGNIKIATTTPPDAGTTLGGVPRSQRPHIASPKFDPPSPMPVTPLVETTSREVLETKPITAVAYPEGSTPAGAVEDALAKGGTVMKADLQTVVTNVRVLPPDGVAA